MKNALSSATIVGQLAVAAVVLQGCQTYTAQRTALGNSDTTGLKPGTVVTINGTGTQTTSVTPAPVVQSTVPVEFVVPAGGDLRDPYVGFTRTSTPHTPTPPPAPVTVKPTSSEKSVIADGKYVLYTVKKGDTAGTIANRHGMTLAEFVKLNNIAKPDQIRVGQEFKVMADSKPLNTAKDKSTAGSEAGTYTVVAGDTLSEIAAKHGMKTAELMTLNGIQDANRIRVGQKLRVANAVSVGTTEKKVEPVVNKPAKSTSVPTPPPSTPVVESNDLEMLIDMTTSGTGAVSLIDAKEAVTAQIQEAVKPVVQAATAASSYREHTVQENEDIFTLAVRYGVRPMDIRRENGMTGSALTPGSVIKIPPVSGN